ncbi:MAG: putative Zn-dependent protease with MMP-like domain [Myxococcota bacterium]|jgi:predicted Zn-dependent protease with MMP-like domain
MSLPSPADQASVDALIDAADDALTAGDVAKVFDLCERIEALWPSHIDGQFLVAEAHRLLGDDKRAEAMYRMVLEAEPSHGDAWAGLAAVRFYALDFDGAGTAASRSIRLDPEGGEGWWWRGLVREQRGDFLGADRDFRRASIRLPTVFPWPVRLTDAMVESMLQVAVKTMHPLVQATLPQVSFFLEEVPSRQTLIGFDPVPAPHELLGYFTGVPLSERAPSDSTPVLPAAIFLYRRNLERIATDREALLEELRITVLHELGHYLGLSEDDLLARGLD